MAEQPKAHLWVNTGIAGLALLTSLASAVFASQTYGLKTESLGFNVQPTTDCKLQFVKILSGGALGLCSIGTVTNQSELRTSLVSYQAFDVSRGKRSYTSGFVELEDGHGKPVQAPIVLEGGEARSFVMRVPVAVPAAVANIVVRLQEQSANMATIMREAATAGFDIVGHVIVQDAGGGRVITWSEDSIVAEGEMIFQTGEEGRSKSG
jgi:hypothetical protein